LPEPGQLVHLRQRRWLVEAVEEALRLGEATLVHAACVDDDAQGEPVSILWDMSWMRASSRTHCPTSGRAAARKKATLALDHELTPI
jgi:hypothetical protein